MDKRRHKKKNEILMLLVTAFILLSIPVWLPALIHLAKECDLPAAKALTSHWGEVSTFVDPVLGYLGTVTFSALALYQNMKLDAAHKEHEERMESWEKESTERPFFVIEKVEHNKETVAIDSDGCHCFLSQQKHSIATITLRNIGRGPAIDIKRLPVLAFGDVNPAMKAKSYCLPNDERRCSANSVICLAAPISEDICNEDGNGQWEISYSNMLGQRYAQDINFSITEEGVRGEVPADVREPEDSTCGAIIDVNYCVKVAPISTQRVI